MAPEPPLTGRRILVAEDEALILLEIEDVLRESGALVVGPTSSVGGALATLDQCPVDGALLDVSLRGVSILPVAQRLNAAGVPFILVTGSAASAADDPVLQRAPRLLKPFREQHLKRAMRAHLAAT